MKTNIQENLRSLPSPPAQPSDPAFVVEPTFAAKVARSKVNGGSVELARHQCITDTSNMLAAIARIAPTMAQKHYAKAGQIEAITTEYPAAIAADHHVLSEYRSFVRGRAITVAGILEKEKLLEDAKNLLESPDSLQISGQELLVLNQRVRHLPAVIKTEWAEMPAHETRIRELEEKTGIPVEKIIADLIEQLTGPDGRCTDLDLSRAAPHLALAAK